MGLISAAAALCTPLVGCAPVDRLTLEQRIAAAARPLLTLDPEADWTAAFNQLVDAGDPAVTYLADRLRTFPPEAHNDLALLLHNSLLKQLIGIGRGPKLSLRAYEITLDVLHLDPNVRGRRLGPIQHEHPAPTEWTSLYPADFNHDLAAVIDLPADRDALLAWVTLERRRGGKLARALPLTPTPQRLLDVLARRPADRWQYAPEPRGLRVHAPQRRLAARPVRLAEIVQDGQTPRPPPSAVLLDVETADYNLVRAACIQLARSRHPAILDQLIRRIAHPDPVVAYNARFALTRSVFPEIRERMRSIPAKPAPREGPHPPALLVLANDVATFNGFINIVNIERFLCTHPRHVAKR